MPMPLRILIAVTLAAVVAAAPIKGMNQKLDDTGSTTTNVPPDDQIKCGGCPCNNPCYITSPPPPPPPKMPTPTPGLNCPPPPTGGGYGMAPPAYIYITAPPGNGNLYPVNPYFSGAHRKFWAASPVVMVFGLLAMVVLIFNY